MLNDKDFDDLRKCLKKFKDTFCRSSSQGNFRISVGDYNNEWDLYYQNNTIFQSISNEIRVNDFDATIKDFRLDKKEILDVLHGFFPNSKFIVNKNDNKEGSMFVVNVKGDGKTLFHFESKNEEEAYKVYNIKLNDVFNDKSGYKVEIRENGFNIDKNSVNDIKNMAITGNSKTNMNNINKEMENGYARN